ncbi:MAG: HD-GYP domain-containing protein, partial [Bacilli bacterium]|nr:HD-GYP domain-containing protein [Bacilli bacterium]
IFGEVALTGEPCYYENYLETTKRHYSTYTYSPKKGQFAVLVSDITERIERETEVEYISYHDYLTGLHNRRYYEKMLLKMDIAQNLPLSLIMGDVNGLKLVNDSFGHKVGDELLKKVSSILQEACRSNDVIARIGGDEFVIILPKTEHDIADKIIERIKNMTKNEKVESLEISISFGHSTKTLPSENIHELFKKIEDEMYAKKLTESRSMRSKTIDVIMQTLYEKNHREMQHSLRVSALCEQIAREMKLDKDAIGQIKTAGLMHDIGKIAISEEILNKPTTLLSGEWNEVKRHSEIGYRILNSVNEFSDIANYILEHHEKWNGTGYPKGLKGEEISLQARIINVADAFDAMTGYRTYRTALSKEDAIAEIIKYAGIQFDPSICKIFVENILHAKYEK